MSTAEGAPTIDDSTQMENSSSLPPGNENQAISCLPVNDDVIQWNAFLMKVLSDTEEDLTNSHNSEQRDQALSLEFLDRCPRQAAYQIHDRVPLHAAVDCRDPQPTVVLWLAEAAPEMVHVRDAESGLLPVEMLSSHILAKEERQRYDNNNSNNNSNDDTSTVAKNWDCVGILARHHSKRYRENDQNPHLLHACLAAQMEDASNFPFALLERALRRYKHQAAEADDSGNLPLHIVLTPRQPEEFDVELVEQVYNLAPEAVQAANRQGCWPLDFALAASKRRHEAGDQDEQRHLALLLRKFAQANPARLGLLTPFLLTQLLQRASPDAAFLLLQTAFSNFL
jgi:hypothetical protein